VGVRHAGGDVVLWVTDTGPGIPAGEAERVFERFHRVPGSEGSGCGLGLSIVERIAMLHGARVKLEAAPRGGLRVEVIFPASRAGQAGLN